MNCSCKLFVRDSVHSSGAAADSDVWTDGGVRDAGRVFRSARGPGAARSVGCAFRRERRQIRERPRQQERKGRGESNGENWRGGEGGGEIRRRGTRRKSRSRGRGAHRSGNADRDSLPRRNYRREAVSRARNAAGFAGESARGTFQPLRLRLVRRISRRARGLHLDWAAQGRSAA